MYALLACKNSPTQTPGRYLDSACASGCKVEGSARSTSGITADSTGFSIGPEPGALTIPVGAVGLMGDDTFAVSLLARGHGTVWISSTQPTCSGPCSEHSMTPLADLSWIDVGGGTVDGGSLEGLALKIEIRNAGSTVEIADLRVQTYEAQTGSSGCSVTR